MRSPRFSVVFLLALAAACEDELEVRAQVYGFEPEDVVYEVEDLGKLERPELIELSHRGDVDGSALLSEAECGGTCRAALVTLFIKNRGSEPVAPPVVRFSSPPGRRERLPVAYRGEEISPGRTGRLRFLVTPWPGEKVLTVTLSGSVFIEIKSEPEPEPESESESEAAPKGEVE